MKLILMICAAAAVALPAHFIGCSFAQTDVAPAVADTANIEVLSDKVEALRQKNRELATQVDAARKPATTTEIADAAIAEAVDPWLERKAEIEAAKATATNPGVDVAIADMPIPGLIAKLRVARPFSEDSEAVYKELRKAKRLDELIEAVEALVEAQPDDADLYVFLGVTYLQKLFTLEMSMETGRYAMQADQAFSDALDLDSRNVNARFTKAVSLSNWPEFLGKTKPAIKQFKILIEQLEAPGAENFAEPYLYLGNMYKRIGDEAKARAAWLAGQKLFPKNTDLAKALK